MKNYSRKHIGKRHKTNEGYWVEVIDGGSKPNYCTIKFDDLDHETEEQYSNVERGRVTNPFHLSVYDKGYLGVGAAKKSENGKQTKVHQMWQSMIQRAYDPKFHERNPTYKDVEVCDEWLNFQVFAKWYSEQPFKHDALDKDILSNGAKVYSPENCVLVSHELNKFMTIIKSGNTSEVVGVTWDKRLQKWRVQINDPLTGKKKFLGYFDNKYEGGVVYRKARLEIYQTYYKPKFQHNHDERIFKMLDIQLKREIEEAERDYQRSLCHKNLTSL